MAEALDPLSLPLHGSRLVEASAGTGKTWTLAALYLRLVLGHGELRPLLPAEILVMTFTKAATRELSDRIRARLVQAAAFFRGAPADVGPEHEPDPFLHALRDAYASGPARDAAAWRLALAAEAMDDAAVHTIDAWCQRMLREHAFDSGSLFDEELQPNETLLLRQAARDYWRQQVYPLRGSALQAVLALWPQVAQFSDDMRRLIDKPLPAPPPGTLGEFLQAHQASSAARRADLKSGWAERARDMRAWLERELLRKPRRIGIRADKVAEWTDALLGWAEDPLLDEPALTDTAWQRLSADDLQQKGDLGPLPAGFAAMPALHAALQRQPRLVPLLRTHALAHVKQRLQRLKHQSARYGYADLLQRLDDALDAPGRGHPAQALRERIVAQFPAALIDEFQDTSPRQLSIFDRVYDIAANVPERLLLLIGDPKQSIYGFRGADIHSYLQARAATAGRHHMLATNRRATLALVRAVNTLFERAEARPGAGAFLFRSAAGDGLPFHPVLAQGRPEVLVRDGAEVPALTFCLDAELSGITEHRERYADVCAERIVALLGDASAAFEGPAGRQRVRPRDVAVLVRTGVEATLVQQALRRRGVASVYLSDKDSVYQSAEAAELLRLLQAVAQPRHVRLARAALATRVLGRTLPELLRLAADDLAFDVECEHLRTLQGVWQQQGVLTMLRRALHLFDLPARLLAAADGEGERRLTNVLHLAELLQAASAQVEGEAALVRWLAAQIEAAQGDVTPAEEQVLRLESDADLVQVVTVHKAKGLEYPVVFVPFASGFRAVEGRTTDAVMRRDGGAAPWLDLAPDKAALAAADDERLQEDVRLLYVALTRARHALWVGAAALRVGTARECQWHRSALGYLVSGSDARAPELIGADLQALAAAAGGSVVVEPAPGAALPLTRWQPHDGLAPLPPAPVYAAGFDRSWTIGSYSALVRDAAGAAAPARVLRDDDDDDEATLADDAPHAHAPWHRFPRGAFAGNFLHDQLEWLAGEGFGLDGSPALQQALARRCERQGWGARAADAVAWLRRALAEPLPPLGAPLQALAGRVLPEMEFWLPAQRLDAARLDALCREHLYPGAPRPALTPRVLHGLLMGFADLVFEHDARYWVLDYKSNALGPRDADYGSAALQNAMLHHRYDVQAALYGTALHRLLRVRLGARYEPARDLGGAVYFFLRGVGHAGRGCEHLRLPPALLQALEGMLP